jgi:hypothetical protein
MEVGYQTRLSDVDERFHDAGISCEALAAVGDLTSQLFERIPAHARPVSDPAVPAGAERAFNASPSFSNRDTTLDGNGHAFDASAIRTPIV